MAIPTIITVSGTYLKLDGTPESGTITFRAKTFVLHGESASVMVPSSISDTLDGAGSFSVNLPATDDPDWTPVGWTYEVVINLSQSVTKYHVQIPYDATGGDLLMSEILPVAAGFGISYAPISHEHTGYVTLAELEAEVASALEDSPAIGDAVEAAVGDLLDDKLDKVDGEVVDSTFSVRKADNSSGIRMRATGGAVDFDKMNGDIIISSFAGPAYTGAQTNLQRWRANGTTFVGLTYFSDSAYGEQQLIDGTAGVAKLGAKNSLANLVVTGFKATAGAPGSGTWVTNDAVFATDGWWYCSSGGTPGTWVQATPTITKTTVGLSNVDNTSDAAKPVSTAQQTALNLKANLASPTFTGTVAGITQSMVGLGNVDNTADASKPVSTAQQTALNLKANLASPTFTGTVAGITKSMIGLSNVDNTADTAKPVSTDQQTALNLKANLASPTFTGTVSGITKSMVGLSNVDNTSDSAKPVSAATTVELAANVKATDHSLGGWTFDPAQVQGAVILSTAGLSYVVRLRIMIPTVTNIHMHFTVAGSTLTSGQCFASLHTDAGVLVGSTVDQATNWASSGYKTCALAAPQSVTPGNWYKIRFWFNGTTGPTVSRGVNSSTAITNAGLSAPNFRFATADSGLTTAGGAPGTIGTMTGGPTAWWIAVS